MFGFFKRLFDRAKKEPWAMEPRIKLDIEEFKLILIYKSLTEIKAALSNFDIASFDSSGNNILHYYVKGYESISVPVGNVIQLFIDFGIDVNARQSKLRKRTAMHFAVGMQSTYVFDILLNNGADINIKDADGNVPLFSAVMGYRGEDGYLIETLISKGADVDAMNNYGVTPKSLAFTIANYDTRKFFA